MSLSDMVKVVCYDHFLLCDKTAFIHLWKLIKKKKKKIF